MKKIIGTIIGITVWGVAFSQTAQTGINTTTPQQTLQVSGTTSATAVADGTTGKFLVKPTIRIEGLNNANNSAAFTGLGTTATLPLYATSNGDLVIGGNRVNRVLRTFPVTAPPNGDGGVDAVTIPPTAMNMSAVYPNITSTSTVVKSQSFTLARTSMVYISVSVGIGTLPQNNGPKAQMNGIKLQFSAVGAGSGIPTGIPFASSTDSYATLSGTQIPTGNYWYNVSKELKLPPGDYTLQVWGIGTAGSAAGPPFTYQIGQAGNDNINIIAIAL